MPKALSSDVNNTIAAAGISMGLGGTRALTNQIGRTFGLSGLALDAQGTGDDTQVSVDGLYHARLVYPLRCRCIYTSK